LLNLRPWLLPLALTASVAALGCDPSGPGVEGSIDLGPGISTDGFSKLEIRGTPDDGKPFDFANPPKAPDPGWSVTADLTEVKFPYAYEMGQGLGTTSDEKWRAFAWLSAGEQADGPKSGEPFGMITFAINECGPGFGDYCGTTVGVNFTISQVVP